jgi:hypothetical protein
MLFYLCFQSERLRQEDVRRIEEVGELPGSGFDYAIELSCTGQSIGDDVVSARHEREG